MFTYVMIVFGDRVRYIEKIFDKNQILKSDKITKYIYQKSTIDKNQFLSTGCFCKAAGRNYINIL